MTFTRISFEKQDRIAKITLNRPDKLNAIGEETLTELQEVVYQLQEDDSVRVVVLASTGRAFSAGADLESLRQKGANPREMDAFLRLWNRVFTAIENLNKPVIASVQGFALAGGLELLMVCDLVIASESAQIGDAHSNFGLIPGGGNSQRLPRAIGARRAKELMYTGDFLSARDAERIGLVNRVVPAEQLEAETLALAQKLAEKSPVGLAAIKRLAQRGLEMDLASGLELELTALTTHMMTEDAKEGVTAFAEKRKPVFPGR
ncbi:MAG: enoyl-CoA hydratase [Chloroflexi bacterium]|nr:enoyl-CoA hydratase [Chloroflexota bacterium]